MMRAAFTTVMLAVVAMTPGLVQAQTAFDEAAPVSTSTASAAPILKTEPSVPDEGVTEELKVIRKRRNPAAQILFWSGLAGVAAGGALGVASFVTAEELTDGTVRPPGEAEDLRAQSATYGTVADVSLAAGGALLGVGLLMWVTGWGSKVVEKEVLTAQGLPRGPFPPNAVIRRVDR
jgi:hypothetical protein